MKEGKNLKIDERKRNVDISIYIPIYTYIYSLSPRYDLFGGNAGPPLISKLITEVFLFLKRLKGWKGNFMVPFGFSSEKEDIDKVPEGFEREK